MFHKSRLFCGSRFKNTRFYYAGIFRGFGNNPNVDPLVSFQLRGETFNRNELRKSSLIFQATLTCFSYLIKLHFRCSKRTKIDRKLEKTNNNSTIT